MRFEQLARQIEPAGDPRLPDTTVTLNGVAIRLLQRLKPLDTDPLDSAGEQDEIAERIGITRHGVKAHLSIIFELLGVSSRTEASSIAFSLNLF